jgi:membrane-associated protease RseP (regulator of RpoE activity)
MKLSPTRAALFLAVALALPAAAQEWTLAPDAKAPTAEQQKQLDAAKAQLDAAAKRYAELAGRYGADPVRFKVEQHLMRKPVIGVVLAPDDTAGVHIAGVTPDSAAAVAGVRSGDRIIAIDGRTLAGGNADARLDAARAAIGAHDEKSQVKLRLVRDGKETAVAVTPRPGERMIFIPEMRRKQLDGNVRITELPGGGFDIDADRMSGMIAPVAPDVRREIVLMQPGAAACKGEHCKMPVIADALRWNGLNLASVDGGLGRYFGADEGVLVVSTGPELEGLQAGDVIRSVDGKPVKSPRDVMDALRGREAGSKVAVGYLRDRKAGNTQVTVPEPMMFRIPAPPAPPAPPAAPAPPAPPMAPRAPGLVAPAPPAPPPPSLPVD